MCESIGAAAGRVLRDRLVGVLLATPHAESGFGAWDLPVSSLQTGVTPGIAPPRKSSVKTPLSDETVFRESVS